MESLVCPIGHPRVHVAGVKRALHSAVGARRALGLIDNSKPNVAHFLEGVMASGAVDTAAFDVCDVRKPRSAAVCPDLDWVREHCGSVINAVAD